MIRVKNNDSTTKSRWGDGRHGIYGLFLHEMMALVQDEFCSSGWASRLHRVDREVVAASLALIGSSTVFPKIPGEPLRVPSSQLILSKVSREK